MCFTLIISIIRLYNIHFGKSFFVQNILTGDKIISQNIRDK